MDRIRRIESDQLSTFRTSHVFERYAEFRTAEEFVELAAWAAEHGARVFILGNGSNTLFKGRSVQTLVLRNRLERSFEQLDEFRVRVSSSTLITTVLKHCEKQRLDSFYYLASVPATIGGALAMNAGRGRQLNLTIYDFVESLTYVDSKGRHVLTREEIDLGYRQTMFTGLHERLITEAVLRFRPQEDAEGKIRERIEWSKQHQDHSAPNCGTVFRDCSTWILLRMRGFRVNGACYSAKVGNWILNRSSSSRSICRLIWLTRLVHRVFGRRAELELIEVE